MLTNYENKRLDTIYDKKGYEAFTEKLNEFEEVHLKEEFEHIENVFLNKKEIDFHELLYDLNHIK